MPDSIVQRLLLRLAPAIVPGAVLHRRALEATAAGRASEAERFYECAARRYRSELAVEPLARLRVHQAMTRARACNDPGAESAMLLGIVQSLNKLDQLEALQAPFDLADARQVLALWLGEEAAGARDASGWRQAA